MNGKKCEVGTHTHTEQCRKTTNELDKMDFINKMWKMAKYFDQWTNMPPASAACCSATLPLCRASSFAAIVSNMRHCRCSDRRMGDINTIHIFIQSNRNCQEQFESKHKMAQLDRTDVITSHCSFTVQLCAIFDFVFFISKWFLLFNK